jgi:tetratricopeptide (TPR) repeat protein
MLLGWTLNATARPAEAMPIMEQAAAALEKLLSENPKDQGYTNELAECYVNQVQACEQRWKDLDAQQFKQRSLDLLATFPAHLPHTYMAYRRVGENFSSRGLADDAVEMHRKALALLERMVDYEVASNALTNDNLRLEYRLKLAEVQIAAKRGDEAESTTETTQTSNEVEPNSTK